VTASRIMGIDADISIHFKSGLKQAAATGRTLAHG